MWALFLASPVDITATKVHLTTMLRIWHRGVSGVLALVLLLGSLLALGHQHEEPAPGGHGDCGCAHMQPDASPGADTLQAAHDDCAWCGFLASLNSGSVPPPATDLIAPVQTGRTLSPASVDLPVVLPPATSARGPPILG